MKAVMLSLRPQWCEKIFNGSKSIEVRKSRPSLDMPFKVYVYMTKHKWIFKLLPFLKNRFAKVIGEFVCDEIYVRPANVIYYGKGQEDYLDLLKSACMTEREVLDYMGGQFNRETYFWHVTDLKIYDKPKELGEFGNYKTEWVQWYHSDDKVFYQLARPPQSWCYVEELQ